MTTKPPLTAQEAARLLPPLPDPPQYDMEQHRHYVMTGIPITLALHLDAMDDGSTTLVTGNGYLCRRRSDLPSCPYPDLLVAFNVDASSILFANGYVVEEAGKPPDLVLEVASQSTGRRDYMEKPEIYASMGVPEYWRFDYTGGSYHDTALGGDVLSPDGGYQPITITTEPDGVIWGYSEVLGLSVCWVEGSLRFWDREHRRYLPTQTELALALSESESRVAEAEARERQARSEADHRIRELEEELRRLKKS